MRCVTVEDAVGTPYATFSDGGGGRDDYWQGAMRIAPTFPSGARELRIRVHTSPNASDTRDECQFTVKLN
jgi:hypothetical protein